MSRSRASPTLLAMDSASRVVDWEAYDAVLFDLDGVITPTADIHEHAWAALFARWDFTSSDYLTYVDGKPRYDGVQSFLRSRGVDLPWGDPTDLPGDSTVCALGNRKNDLFNEALERDGVEPYPGTTAVLDLLDDLGIPQAIVSSSKNARAVLAAAGMADRFPVVVDGLTAVEEELAGKPDPAMFEYADKLLGARPERSVVVEDASSGVAAGTSGGFALVLGVDRGANREALLEAGARSRRDRSGRNARRGTRGQAGCNTFRESGERPIMKIRATTSAIPAIGSRSTRGASSRPNRVPSISDSVRRCSQTRNGYIGMRANPSEGWRRPRSRHVSERISRDLADQARRGRIRLRQDGPDHRQRARRQAPQAVRRRRAPAARRCGSRRVRACHGFPYGGLVSRIDLAHAGREARPRALRAHGQSRTPASRRDATRRDLARRERPGRHLVPVAQPARRRRRVSRNRCSTGRGRRPAPGAPVRPPGAAAPSADPPRPRRSGRGRGHAGLPLHEQRDDSRLRLPARGRDSVPLRSRDVGRPQTSRRRCSRSRRTPPRRSA